MSLPSKGGSRHDNKGARQLINYKRPRPPTCQYGSVVFPEGSWRCQSLEDFITIVSRYEDVGRRCVMRLVVEKENTHLAMYVAAL